MALHMRTTAAEGMLGLVELGLTAGAAMVAGRHWVARRLGALT